MFTYYLLKGLSWIVCLLPRLARRLIGAGIGRLAWHIVPSWRQRMAVDNIRSCLGYEEADALKIAKRSVWRFGHMLIEELYFPRINKDNIEKFITFKGGEHLQQAYNMGRGVVLATAHYGNWELTATAVSLAGYKQVSVGRKQNNAGADRFIHEYREMHGAKMIYKTGVLEMTRLLGQGHCIGLLMDQDAGHTGLPMVFLGKESFVPSGPAALSRLCGAPIVPILSYSLPNGEYIQEFFPMLYSDKTSDREQDIKNTTDKLLRIIEQEIIKRPEEWFWLHNRWRLNKD